MDDKSKTNPDKSINVFYASFPYFGQIAIAKYLRDNYRWVPSCWISADKYQTIVEKEFPGVFSITSSDLRRGRFYGEIESPRQIPIDKTLLNAFAEYESTVLAMMLRRDSTGWNFSYSERRDFYHNILKYWVNMIDFYKPDLFLSWVIPHGPEEYVLYKLCRYLKIPTVFVNPTPIFDTYYYIADSVEDLSSPITKVYRSNNDNTISIETKSYLDKLRSRKGFIAKHMQVYWGKSEEKNTSPTHLIRELLQLLRKHPNIFAKTGSHWKSSKHPVESSKSEMNYLQDFLFNQRLRRNNIKMESVYNSFTTTPDLTEKYIYFAPNYQPEANVTPPAGVYSSFTLIVDILAASIPDDWIIYYKEHPSTFMPEIQGSLARDRNYYDRLNSYKNVRIIPYDFNTFKLIDNSQAVATPTGTVGWEAAVRGKPVLVFGQVWYVGCDSIFLIETFEDCRDAIKKIIAGYIPDPKDIELYASAVEAVAEKDLLIRDFPQRLKNCSNPDYELQRVAKELYKAYHRQCVGKTSK